MIDKESSFKEMLEEIDKEIEKMEQKIVLLGDLRVLIAKAKRTVGE